MARLLVYLVTASLVLNALTFVFVVTQGPLPEAEPGTGHSKDARAKDSGPGAASSFSSQLGAVNRGIQSIQRDLRSVKTRVDGLEPRVRGVDTALRALDAKTARLLAAIPSEAPLEAKVPDDDGDRTEAGAPPENDARRVYRYSTVPGGEAAAGTAEEGGRKPGEG